MEKSSASSNPAEIRGDIQAGLTGDKRPGFDPALAPLETDAEAAGTPLSPEQIETARRTQRQGKRTDVSGDDGTAMRPIFPANNSLQKRIPVMTIAFGLLAVAVLAAAVMLFMRWD
jgi:hypothetical protein